MRSPLNRLIALSLPTFVVAESSAVSEYNYPVGFSFPISHASPNLALPHGAVGRLCVDT